MNEDSTYAPLTVDQIRSQMRQYRREFGSDVDEFVASTQSLTDWKQYVMSKPFIAFGVCAAMGYTLVPKRKHLATADPQMIAELVKRDKLVVARPQNVKRSGGLMPGILATLTRVGLQTASGIVMQKLGAAMESTPEEI